MNVGANQLAALRRDVLLAAHPIGSYYWSDNATSPAALFGGSWERIKDKFVLAAGDTYAAGKTGGAASVTSGGTAIGVDHLPNYNMEVIAPGTALNQSDWPYMYGDAVGGSNKTVARTWFTDSIGGVANAAYVNSKGKGVAHTHTVATMPPYIVAYCWRRVA